MCVRKWSFVFLQQNTKFKTVSKQPFAFYNETQNFENCTHTAIRFLTANNENRIRK